MSTKFDSLKFPSGRTVCDCRKDAKILRVEQGIGLSAAQDLIASRNGCSGAWATAIYDLKNTSLEEKLTLKVSPISRVDIELVLKDLPELTHFCFGTYRRHGMTAKEYVENLQRDRLSLVSAEDECNKAYFYLKHLTKRKTINSSSTSYGLKHQAEFYLKARGDIEIPYVANGAFICAAYFMGYQVKLVRPGSPNVCINYSQRSPIIRWRNLASRSMYITKEYIVELDELEKELELPRSDTVHMFESFLQ